MMEEGTKQPLPALKWSVPPMPSTAAGRTTATRTPPMQTMAPPMAPPIHPVHPSSIAQPLMPPVRQQNPPPAGYMAAPNKADLPPYPSTSAPPAKPLTSLSQSQSQASRPQQPPLSQNPPPKAPASSSKSSRPTPSNDLLLPTSLLEPMPGAEDLHLVSPSAAALRAISLQSPAHARPRNSPTPGPRSAQSHRSSVDFDPSAAVGTQGPMFPPLTLQPIVQGGGLMTSYGALRQEIRGAGNASGGSGGSFSAYGAGKAIQGGYAAKAAARAIQEGRYPPGAVILPGGGFDDGGDLPEGWDLKERPQGLLNLIHEGSKSFSGSTGWSHHPFILPPEEPLQHHPHPKTKQTGSYASRASERISSNMEGPSAAKSSGSSGSLAKELKSKSSSSLQPDQPSPLSTSSSNSVTQIQSASAVAQKPVPQVAPPTSAATAAAATQSAAHVPRKYAPPPVTSQLGEEAVKVQAPLQQPSTSKVSRPPAAGMTSGS